MWGLGGGVREGGGGVGGEKKMSELSTLAKAAPISQRMSDSEGAGGRGLLCVCVCVCAPHIFAKKGIFILLYALI